jgi:hypothetical protein
MLGGSTGIKMGEQVKLMENDGKTDLGAKSREKVTLRGKKRCKNSDLA